MRGVPSGIGGGVHRGRLGGRLGTQTILVLTTTGRKTGQRRAIPIAYFRDGANFFIVASNWGKDQQAAWYLNLHADPHAQLEVGGKQQGVHAFVVPLREGGRLCRGVRIADCGHKVGLNGIDNGAAGGHADCNAPLS